ncbi:hypothetical protein Vadar_003508 [Vaccinium darrowii]|uniref:Uncharacterized protein n=1 Tax=Vaccinium darrowii TaxID=229202 RepID=A0ACB7Z1N2_9ERIC|nr:hypothetical protein Vadar_003508 [Vaccinium darrowii]
MTKDGKSASAAPHHTPKRNPPQSASHGLPHAPVQSNSGDSIIGRLRATIAQGMCFGTGSIVDAVAQRAESDVNAMEDRVADDVAQSTESAIDDEAQRAESDVNVVAQRVVDAVP